MSHLTLSTPGLLRMVADSPDFVEAELVLAGGVARTTHILNDCGEGVLTDEGCDGEVATMSYKQFKSDYEGGAMECTHGGVGDCWRCNDTEPQGLWLVQLELSDGHMEQRAVCTSAKAAMLYLLDDLAWIDDEECQVYTSPNRGGSVDVYVEDMDGYLIRFYKLEPGYRLITEDTFGV